MFLSDISIKRPVFATMMMVALVVLGVVSYKRLAIDEYPDITYPVVIAQTTYPGASPEVMMREVSKPIEEALNTVQGIKEITSTSLEGVSIVRLAVQPRRRRRRRAAGRAGQGGAHPALAAAGHRGPDHPALRSERLADHVDRAAVERAAASASSPTSRTRSCRRASRRSGRRRREHRRRQRAPDPRAGRSGSRCAPTACRRRSSPRRCSARIRKCRPAASSVAPRSGSCASPAASSIRRPSPTSPSPCATARPIRISDVATVVDGAEERRTGAEISDRDAATASAVSLEVLKISGANTVAVADAVRAAVGELERQLPRDIKMTVIRDDSRRIRESLADVRAHDRARRGAHGDDHLPVPELVALDGHHRASRCRSRSSPRSSSCGCSTSRVNTMTLLALSLAIGLLIDDAIVVRENIVRHLEMGKAHDLAAKEGTDEIGLAVMATTLRRRRRVHPRRVHGRHHRQDLLPVRRHRHLRRARLAVRELHARPDALERLGRSRGRARRRTTAASTRRRSAGRRTRSAASPSRSTTGSSAWPTAIRAGSAGRSATALIVLGVAASTDRRQLPHPARSSASPGCRTSTATSSP